MIRYPLSGPALAVLGVVVPVMLAAVPTLAGSPSTTGPRPGMAAGPSLLPAPTPVGTPSVTPTTPYREWIPAYCATGGFMPLEVGTGGTVVIPAQATICSRWADKYAFTVVAFRPDRDLAFALSSRLRRYAETGATPIRAVFGSPPGAGRTGVCLMRGSTARIACVSIDVDPQGRVTSRPLSTEDPLVGKPVNYQDDALSPDPGTGFCATCVGI